MPSGKPRDMDDTWAPNELHKSLKGMKDDKKKSRDKDRDKDKDRDRKRDKDRGKDEERSSRRRREDGEKDGKRDKDRERRHRDKENGEHEDRKHRDKDRDKDRDREKRHRDKDKDRDRKKGDEENGRDRRRHRDDKDDEDRKHRKDKEHRSKDKDRDDDDRRRRHKDEDGERKHRRRDEEGGRRRRDKDEDKNDDDRDSKHRREEEGAPEGRDRRRERVENRREREKEKEEKKKKEKESEKEKQTETLEREHLAQTHKQLQLFGGPSTSEPSEDSGPHDTLATAEEVGEEEIVYVDSSTDAAMVTETENLLVFGEAVPKPPEYQEEEDGDDYDYEDDFEDYDDDFEDDDDDEVDNGDEEVPSVSQGHKTSFDLLETPRALATKSPGYIKSLHWDPDTASQQEMDEIMRAMNEENDKLLRDSRNSEEPPQPAEESTQKRPTTASQRTFINFVSAKQRKMNQKASSKAKRRGEELLRIIDLDFVSFDMFDLPPVKEYDLYMRSFGRSDTRQAYVQTNEDNIEREVQTDEIEMREKWSQHPPDDIQVCGGTEAEEIEKIESNFSKQVDTAKLGKFIQRAGQVMSVLIEEERSSRGVDDGVRRQKSNICISEDFIEMGKMPFLAGRCVNRCHFSGVQTNLLLTQYSAPVEVTPGDSLADKGILCVWNVNEPSMPTKVLVVESQPSSCIFSPNNPSLAFGGMVDGSVVLWDLREVSTMHRPLTSDGKEYTLRYPTYNTAGVLTDENHQSPCVALQPITAPGDSMLASVDAGSDVASGSSFQLATLDEAAIVHLWVVAELTHPDPSGSQSDFGLSPGGKVKLIKSSTIMLENPMRDQRLRTNMKAFCMQLLPSDPSHFYVGTDTGCIIHGVRYGGKAPPKAYRGDSETPIEITALDFSPFPEPVFLAGCSDGSLRIYSIQTESPLLTWPSSTDGSPIKIVKWSRSRPSVFFVVDDDSKLYIWDLLMNDAMPLKEEKISTERVTALATSNDHSATGLGTPGRRPQMVACLEDGSIEVHTVSQKFSALMPEEVDQFAALLIAIM